MGSPARKLCRLCQGTGEEQWFGLDDPGSVARIRDDQSYLSGQPDLDAYRPAFEGMALSAKYAGTDVDAVYFYSPIHGLWERKGHILVQEHKRCDPDEYSTHTGQHIALECLAEVSERVSVALTFGPTEDPTRQSYWRLGGDRVIRNHSSDPETWLHGRWIRHVRRRVGW